MSSVRYPCQGKVVQQISVKVCFRPRRDLIAVMRKQLKFRPEIVAATRKTFKKVAKKMEVPLKKLTFVGVHNRYD